MKVINGNCIEVLLKYPNNYFDSVVTDPPYGLGKEPDAYELMKDWIEKGFHEIKGSGFMGKEWDAFVPQPNLWKEIFRVLKPGGHVVAFYGTRTYDWGVMAMRFAGFEVRDCIQWLYGSGFPKSHNIGKAVDKLKGNEREVIEIKEKQGISPSNTGRYNWHTNQELLQKTDVEITKGNSEWEGWGSALKPANEPIVLARKPLEKGLSIAENTLKWGVGGINIDATRVGTNRPETNSDSNKFNNWKEQDGNKRNNSNTPDLDTNKGRFPANVILTHHPECECKGLKKIKAIKGGCKFESAFFKSGESNFTKDGGIGDENGEETVEDWNCHPDCPIKIMDEQSGILKSGKLLKGHKRGSGITSYDGGGGIIQKDYGGDSGGASRFFYCAKASKSERNKGLDGFEEKPLAFSNQAKAELKRGNIQFDGGDAKGHGNSIRHLKNFHPTVKPIKLMQYLARMVTPPNGIVLDPFCGSGTTGIACKLEGFQFVGMEQDPEYAKIAEARIDNYNEEIEEPLELIQEDKLEKPTQGSLF
mgnify:CR=1 FL=1